MRNTSPLKFDGSKAAPRIVNHILARSGGGRWPRKSGIAAITAIACSVGMAGAQPRVMGTAVNATNQKTYLLLESSNWTQARARAVSLGGHLATIRTQGENDFVYSAFSTFGSANRNLWIGLYDPNATNNSSVRATRRLEFVWESEESSTFTNWSGVEPNNPVSCEPVSCWEYFVHIWQPGDSNRGRWNNYSDGTAVFGVPLHGVVEACAYAAISANQATCLTGSATFSVTATGTGPFTYRWQTRLDSGAWCELTDLQPGGGCLGNGGGGMSHALFAGVTGSSLTISELSVADARAYRCVVTNACGAVPSDPASLVICIADVDDGLGAGACDGGVGIEDLLYYLGEYQAGSTRADVDDGSGLGVRDGGVGIEDLLYYLARFEAGC